MTRSLALDGTCRRDLSLASHRRTPDDEFVLGTLRAIAVIDTNVVLDWLVFRDARVDSLVRLVTERRLRWLVSPDMRRELELVLPRKALTRWNANQDEVLMTWDRWAQPVPDGGTPTRSAGVRCSDPDDQKFIDLAIACGARWLFTRDRALLDLARQIRAFGVEVVTPTMFVALHAGAPDLT